MKIRAERKALADTVNWVAQAVPKRLVTPVMGGIYLTATSGRLVARAFDWETAHAAVITGVDVFEDGETVVPTAFLRSVLSGFTGRHVDLELDGTTLTVSSGRATYRCRTLLVADYPTLPTVPPVKGYIDADALGEMVSATVWAADSNAIVPALTSLHVEGSADGTLSIVATDRFVISEVVSTWTGDEAFTANVPAAPFAAALKGLSGQVALAHQDGLFGFSDGDRTITTRTVDADYPKLAPLLRPEADDDAAWNVAGPDLAAAIKRATPLVEAKSALGFDLADELTVTLDSSESGEGTEYLDADHLDGDKSAAFLMDPTKIGPALAALDGKTVRVGVKHGKPITLRSPERPGVTMVLMPRRATGGAR